MNLNATELLLQCSLFGAKIRTVMGRFEDALSEDRIENADMFDITRLNFSSNQHPNRTLRALEAELEKESLDLLLLLSALLEAGKEATLGLADYDTPEQFAGGAADILDELRMLGLSEAALAHRITEIKAEHSVKRLGFALRMLSPLTGQNLS